MQNLGSLLFSVFMSIDKRNHSLQKYFETSTFDWLPSRAHTSTQLGTTSWLIIQEGRGQSCTAGVGTRKHFALEVSGLLLRATTTLKVKIVYMHPERGGERSWLQMALWLKWSRCRAEVQVVLGFR